LYIPLFSCSCKKKDATKVKSPFRNIANVPKNTRWKPNNFGFVFPKTKTDRTVIPNSETLFPFSAEIPLLQNVQIGSKAHTASYSVGTGVLFRGEKRPTTHLRLEPRLRTCEAVTLLLIHIVTARTTLPFPLPLSSGRDEDNATDDS